MEENTFMLEGMMNIVQAKQLCDIMDTRIDKAIKDNEIKKSEERINHLIDSLYAFRDKMIDNEVKTEIPEDKDKKEYLKGLRKAKDIVETEIECEAIDGEFVIRGLRTALRFINKEIRYKENN